MNISKAYMMVDLRRVSSHFVKALFDNVLYIYSPREMSIEYQNAVKTQ